MLGGSGSLSLLLLYHSSERNENCLNLLITHCYIRYINYHLLPIDIIKGKQHLTHYCMCYIISITDTIVNAQGGENIVVDAEPTFRNTPLHADQESNHRGYSS